jgi:hypothetical protein
MSRNKYETGTRNKVIAQALLHAIDDREEMIAGYLNPHWPEVGDSEYYDEEYVAKCKAKVRDFRKVLASLKDS